MSVDRSCHGEVRSKRKRLNLETARRQERIVISLRRSLQSNYTKQTFIHEQYNVSGVVLIQDCV